MKAANRSNGNIRPEGRGHVLWGGAKGQATVGGRKSRADHITLGGRRHVIWGGK
jgi:hypothetical protein